MKKLQLHQLTSHSMLNSHGLSVDRAKEIVNRYLSSTDEKKLSTFVL